MKIINLLILLVSCTKSIKFHSIYKPLRENLNSCSDQEYLKLIHKLEDLRRQSIDSLNGLLDMNIEILNDKDEYGETLLMRAIKKENVELVEFLISRGANIDIKNNLGLDALNISFENLEIFKILVNAKANIDDVTRRVGLSLNSRANLVDIERVRILLKAGADENIDKNYDYKSRNCELIFIHAIYMGNKDLVKFLLKKGVSANTLDNNDVSALFVATMFPKILKTLIKSGADINFVNKNGWHILKKITTSPSNLNNNILSLRILINAGVKLDIQDDGGNTALMIAAGLDRLELVIELLEAGADPDIVNKKGDNALDIAILSEVNIEIINSLVAVGSK